MIHRYLLPVALLAAACGAEPKPPAAAPPAEAPPAAAPGPAASAGALPDVLLRGTVHLGPELTFQSCEARTIVPALDSTGPALVGTYKLMQAQSEPGMYLLVRGARVGNTAVILREIQYAHLPGPADGCDHPLPNAEIVVRGASPDWQVTIAGSGLEFSQATDPVSIVASAVTQTHDGAITRYDIGSGGSHTLQLELTPAACNFGAGYVYAGMRASLVLDGKPLRGCAWRTRL